MNQLFKKTVIFILAAVLCIAITGCKDSGNDDVVDSGSSQSISIFRYDLTSLSTAVRNKTELTTAITNKFNISLTIKTAPSSNWEDTLNTLINTNRIPDLFVFYGPDRPVQYQKWVKQDILLPISDYVSKTKYPNIYARLSEHPEFLNLDYTKNKHYAIPISTADNDHSLYIRTDWLNAVNVKEKFAGEPVFTTDGNRFNLTGPETMEEFYYVCKAFSEQDPDGNGNKDTYGFTTNDSSLWFLNFAFYAYDEGGWHDRVLDNDTNKWTDTWISDGSKEALKFFNRLYSEGLMDLEFVNNTSDEKITKFVTGKCGIMMHNGVSGYSNLINKFYEVNGTHSITYFAPPAGPTGLRGQRGGAGYYCFTGINADVSASKRERILSILDYLMSSEGTQLMLYGVEGTDYSYDENNKIVNLIAKDSKGAYQDISDIDAGALLYSFVSLTENVIYPWSENYEQLLALQEQTETYGRITAPLTYYNGENILSLGQALDDYSEGEYVNLIINPQAGFDSYWSNFVNTYLTDYQGQKVIDEYNKAVEQYCS